MQDHQRDARHWLGHRINAENRIPLHRTTRFDVRITTDISGNMFAIFHQHGDITRQLLVSDKWVESRTNFLFCDIGTGARFCFDTGSHQSE